MDQSLDSRLDERFQAPARKRQLPWHYSLEATARDRDALPALQGTLTPGTRISVTYLPGETLEDRLGTAMAVRDAGFVPVPHISARRLKSHDELDDFLARLQAIGASENVFIIAGDVSTPYGPFADTLSVIDTGKLGRYGVRSVGFAGHPDGHPEVDDRVLRDALLNKSAALAAYGLRGEIVTQFGFDAEGFLSWIEDVRALGLEQLVRIGAPGPANIGTLLKFAARCGVKTSARMMSRYGASVTKLLTTATPRHMFDALEAGYDPAVHGAVRYHLYPFGGLMRTVEWMADYEQE